MGRFKEGLIYFKKSVDQDSQIAFIDEVAAELGVDWREAERICKGTSDPLMPEYSLAYKLNGSFGPLILANRDKKKREEARAMFRELLTPEELEIFDNDPDCQFSENKAEFFEKSHKNGKKHAKKGKFNKNSWKNRMNNYVDEKGNEINER